MTTTQTGISENTKTQEESIPEKVAEVTTQKQFSNDQLLPALYWIWDAFGRCNMPFFLVYDTAESAIAQKDLKGSKIDVGIRKMEWISGGRRILDNFITPIKEDDSKAYYDYKGVPVIVHVYDDTDPCVIQTDMVIYRYEEFKVPNPYKRFLEIYGAA